MGIPTITGIIKRRFLLNFRIDPKVVSQVLPSPFVPKLHNGYAIGGICLIRLEKIRPKISPLPCGLSSENAAHRFAVQWDGNDGVFIPRRDSDSLISQVGGGRIFPGIHHAATFKINSENEIYDFSMKSNDSKVEISFSGNVSDSFPESSCFGSLAESSNFFESGSLGYSCTNKNGRYDGLRLETESWSVRPFHMDKIYSSYYFDNKLFPEGSIEFDHGLFMEDIHHAWHQEHDLCCG